MSDVYVWNHKLYALNLAGKFYFYGDPVPVEQFATSKRQQDLIDAGALVKAEPKKPEKVSKPKPDEPPLLERRPKKKKGR